METSHVPLGIVGLKGGLIAEPSRASKFSSDRGWGPKFKSRQRMVDNLNMNRRSLIMSLELIMSQFGTILKI